MKDKNMNAGCNCCSLSRRRFLGNCGACVAALSLGACHGVMPAGENPDKLKIRLVFTHVKPDQIVWPNVGFDYRGLAARMLSELAPLCPDLDFLPVHVTTEEEAKAVMAKDGEVDGYVLCPMSTGKNPRWTLNQMITAANRPLMVMNYIYSGPFAMGYNGRNPKSVAMSTGNMKDVAAVARSFNVLKKEGATPEDFTASARAAYLKTIPAESDMKCLSDEVAFSETGKCMEDLRSSRILLVGGGREKTVKGIREIFGTEILTPGLDELNSEYNGIPAEKAEEAAEKWIKGAKKVVEPSHEELIKSAAMYLAMRNLLKKHDAQAISIGCLGAFYSGQMKAFPCLGFGALNDEGLVGACEADIQSTITMLAGKHLAGRPGYISDPVFDMSKREIIYAHCVATHKVFGPEGESNPYLIRDHSEDRRGAALQSLMPTGYMTSTMKFYPAERMVLFHQGKAVENIDEDAACRTKLGVRITGDADKLYSNWSHGWHRVTFYGDMKEPVKELCKAAKMKFVEEA